jgi:hypothetical protein
MADYRAYLIKNNRVDIAATIIKVDTDTEAIEQAKQLVDGHDIELWQGPRFVIGFKSKDAK